MHDGLRAWERLYSRRGLHYGGSGDITLLRPHLKVGMLVLDAGCGDGKTASLLAGVCDVVGADFSREALMTLRSQRDPEHRVNLVVCNLLNMPFDSEKFDAVVCVHTLSHMLGRERIAAAEQIARVTRGGGFVFLEAFGRGDVRYGKGEEVEDASFMRGDGVVSHYFRKGEMASLFPGLSVVTELNPRRRISFGTVSGRRDLVRLLLRKP